MAQAAIKRHLKSIVIRAGLESFHLAERAGINEQARGRGLILTLHQVKPHTATNFAPNAGLIVTPEFLDAAIVTLKASGYTPVALEDLPARVAEDPDSEERFVAFTADDGYRNNRDHALPVLQRHSVPLTIFITEGFAKRTHSMWWETAERLLETAGSFSFDFEGDTADGINASCLGGEGDLEVADGENIAHARPPAAEVGSRASRRPSATSAIETVSRVRAAAGK